MTEVLALIPARGGSKGIPRKNIRAFAGFPLVSYSIAAARQANTVRRIVVSTDDEEISAIARQYGAETPFLRPPELARDATTDLPVIEHALNWFEQAENYRPDLVVQLRPTSPLRPPGLVDSAVHILLDHPDADSVRGVVPAAQNPHKMWRFVSADKPIEPLLVVPGMPEPYNAPRQVLPLVYWQTGHIDVIRVPVIMKKHTLTGDVVYPVVIDSRYSVDIDNLADWARYESLVYSSHLDIISPRSPRRSMPQLVRMIICDFDGVVTDNRVWTDEDGKETVAATRADSMRVRDLHERGVEIMILSSEPNPVVQARASKMGVAAVHGIDIRAKGEALIRLLSDKQVAPSQVIYIGNDTNDLPCFEIAGWAVAVADASPEAIRAADYVLSRRGGHGAVRELCDLVIKQLQEQANGA